MAISDSLLPEPDCLHYDVVVVGAGPAGLNAALHLREQGRAAGLDLSVAVLEKAARVGGHLLSGALLDPAHLTLLPPELAALPAPGPSVDQESLWLLSKQRAWPLPVLWSHIGHQMISLGSWCRHLAQQAEEIGVDIFPGFAAVELLLEQDRVVGVRCGDLGRDRRGNPQASFLPGALVRAKITILAEGCRGYLSQQAMARFDLQRGRAAQTYALGFKELRATPRATPGVVRHTLGEPLDGATHGGGFLYYPEPERIALGLVIGLDYRDPRLDPFQRFQQWKNHPAIAPLLQESRPLAYGARTLVEGGWPSLPKLCFPGGMLVGDGAGLLNPAQLQGIGGALTSGKLAAEAAIAAIAVDNFSAEQLQQYADALHDSAWGQALRAVRNVRPGFRRGRWPGLLNAAWEWGSRGRSPWSWSLRQQDRERMERVTTLWNKGVKIPPTTEADVAAVNALSLSGLRHLEEQPCHLRVKDPEWFVRESGALYGHPETRYCPGRVYQIIAEEGRSGLRLQPGNCLHCKSCDIKDPLDAIRWSPPEGGSGPDYGNM